MIHEQLTYSVIRGFRPLLLDLHLPDNAERAPIVIWIHGGDFHSGDRRRLHRTFPRNSVYTSLTSAGIACATIDYRLSAEATWPAQRDDVAAAIAFLLANADEYGLDADRLGVWGDSAGGQLALTAGMTSQHVRAVVAWYPITDIAAMPMDDDFYSPWLGCWPATNPDRVADASPITHVTADAPPCLLVHGTADALVPASQSARMHARLLDTGVESTYQAIAGAGHGFEGHRDVGALVTDSVAYLRSRLTA
ncbi:alpha/beta hydrolase [Allokutzneria sp. A3M-2-11 16]|uniref:alpha/beta hydrolase n=1 Tax=Allokutzneria sp. A3M-2-11 16 TaxID=2962043 RepID=UPI0020B638ED|nr:alpha/beta hydrolase [Allokutzneria sp. A3M-2-11 16]MCP3803112.1 alpha/beta hydrolase [Allokutzneria sp. A3M-2-11 16]